MSQFKVGDRVVRSKPYSHESYKALVPVGTCGVVIEVNSQVGVQWDNEKRSSNSIENIEFEDVYNSPLYQAFL